MTLSVAACSRTSPSGQGAADRLQAARPFMGAGAPVTVTGSMAADKPCTRPRVSVCRRRACATWSAASTPPGPRRHPGGVDPCAGRSPDGPFSPDRVPTRSRPSGRTGAPGRPRSLFGVTVPPRQVGNPHHLAERLGRCCFATTRPVNKITATATSRSLSPRREGGHDTAVSHPDLLGETAGTLSGSAGGRLLPPPSGVDENLSSRSSRAGQVETGGSSSSSVGRMPTGVSRPTSPSRSCISHSRARRFSR